MAMEEGEDWQEELEVAFERIRNNEWTLATEKPKGRREKKW